MEGFKLEEYLGKYEFSGPEMLCASDLEGWKMQDILNMADAKSQAMWQNLSLAYTEVRGHPLLREEILKDYSPTFHKDKNIIVTAGAEEALYATIKALLTPNDHAIIMSPCYQSHFEIPKSIGCQVSEWSLNPKENWQPDLRQLKSLIQPNTKLIVINIPHNPTGMLCSESILKEIIKIAEAHGIYLLNDEIYRFMEHDDAQRLPNIADIYTRGISVNVMTKAYGLAGLRIGWVVSNDTKLISEIESYKHYLSICNSAPSEILAIIALKNKHEILNINKDYLLKNLTLLKKFMKEHQDQFEWVEPSGGCIGFIKLKNEPDVSKFCDRIREKENLLLLPADVYHVSEPYFRIGFGRKNFPTCLDKFKKYLQIRKAS